jgi:hypothetical protein
MPDATRLPVTRSNEDTKSTKDAAPRESSEDAPLLAMTDTNSSTLYIGNVPRDVKLEEMKGLLPFQVLSLKRYSKHTRDVPFLACSYPDQEAFNPRSRPSSPTQRRCVPPSLPIMPRHSPWAVER